MPQTPVTARLLPFVDAWFDVVSSLLGAQRLLTYAVLRQDEPTGVARHAERLAPHPVPAPEGWRDTSA